MPGLFNLTDDATFDVDATSTLASVVIRRSPDADMETAATCGCWPGDGPSDLDWADRIARLLALEHRSILDGYSGGVAEELREGERRWPVVAAALSYAVSPDDVGLARLKRACAEYHRQISEE